MATFYPTVAANSGDDVIISVQTSLELVAGICSLLAVAGTFWTIYFHILNYKIPSMQRRIVRILLMVPVYSTSSWLSLTFLKHALIFDTIRDVYEAYVLYQFFMLCVTYLGGEDGCKQVLATKPKMEHPWPCNRCLPLIRVSSPSYYMAVKRGILQYCVIKPSMALLSLVLQLTGGYCEGEWSVGCGYLYVTLINNTSVTLSLYCLALFYEVVCEELKPWRPVWKFLCIKTVIFFSWWQGVMLSVLVAIGVIQRVGSFTPDTLASGIQAFLICLEMLGAAMAHYFVFGFEDYQQIQRPPMSFYDAIWDILSLKDLVHDTRMTFNILPPAYTPLTNADNYDYQSYNSNASGENSDNSYSGLLGDHRHSELNSNIRSPLVGKRLNNQPQQSNNNYK